MHRFWYPHRDYVGHEQKGAVTPVSCDCCLSFANVALPGTPIPVAPFTIVPVDARAGQVVLQAPVPAAGLPVANWLFGVLDVFGMFGVNPCIVVPRGSGVLIWTGSDYDIMSTLLGTGGTTYFGFMKSNQWWAQI